MILFLLKNKSCTITIIILFFSCVINGQNFFDTIKEFSELSESYSYDGEDYFDGEWITSDLIELAEEPLDINSATRDDLSKILFLSDNQIEALLFRRYQSGYFLSPYELQAVEGFNNDLIEKLAPFITFKVDNREQYSNRVFRVRSDLFLRTNFMLETAAGYRSSNNEDPSFLGDKKKVYTRIELQPLRELSLGFVADKDPGEPYFDNNISGFDYWSGYINWKSQSFFKEFNIGQFGMTGGQGLALRSGMPMRKSSMTTSVRNRYAYARPTLSVNEGDGLSGIYFTIGAENYKITPFLSYRYRSARLEMDEDDDVVVLSLPSSGYHRTKTELARRNNIWEAVYGVKGKYFGKRFNIDAGTFKYKLEHPLGESQHLYHLHSFTGRDIVNGWIGYEGTINNIFLFGEAAYSSNASLAWIQGALYSFSGVMDISLLCRDIPKGFNAPLGAPFADSFSSSGETGLYTGIELSLPKGLTLSSYLDYFRHHWLRYRVDAPSSGVDFFSELEYKRDNNWETFFRFRYRERAQTFAVDQPPGYPVEYKQQYQYRIQTRFSPDDLWTFTLRSDLHCLRENQKRVTPGFYMGGDIRYRFNNDLGYIIMRYGGMDVDNYDTRIFVYEPDILYSFSTPGYYGKGSRFVLLTKITPMRKLDFWIRFSRWYYSDRDSVGTGFMETKGNTRHEFRFQLRHRF
ncbi:helix-hairpin-helix domain-containing protein [Marinilabiliaceae bacterium ANBcel2]|nr:helix-hairpin-helix domain-containing protein [Marinilabiliaceae bacterium ANBcel2]